ncbi:MAG: methylated-DNA--[protein]-cysteine S-methyltransferase, partial [Candidatus Aenigmatarchaeota archaeon]
MEAQVFGTVIEIDESFTSYSREPIKQQLREYLEGSRTSFDIAIDYPDSFTGKVMRELAKIPYGETVTYGELSSRLNSSAIAVGQACGRNPIPVILPCHRVVAENGLGGFQYPGL